MKIKRLAALVLGVVITATAFVGCGQSKGTSADASKKQVIKLGVTGDDHKVWDNVKDRLAKENIELKIVSFSDYVRPNMALNDGEIDANAFQTVAYFEQFKKDRNLDLVSIANTVLAPMAIYSSNLKDLKELKDGDKIAIPNDATNGGRALLLLQEAGLIKLKEGSGITPTVKDIVENPKNFEVIPLVATQIPRSIKDVAVAAINNGVAVEAGYSPLEDSIYIEDTKKDSVKNYFNIIAARAKDKDNAALKRLVEIYQTDETKKLIKETTKGSSIPAF
ncbi:MetQ/NlpA family ABC transporter substrate-binding protein [Clostridium sp. HMP27]|uniref:MetQ/NlpA family ABC transporter substrate-binding protein n=1 Tax=Clostridium sp. HMP27 TaxID=1487921 RepID=UPI00052D2249|nr:MetQ/NlpA family ABC transporter substrate-binding protein [Clostridium sp. HMP27]KGK89203.1 methionine ABC transporter substrate-binding protein [Clostridium sp. HMP27]